MSSHDERPASIADMRRFWPDKTDDELRQAADAIAAVGGTLTVVATRRDHEPGCPMNWPEEPRGTRRACWCDLPEDYELAHADDQEGGTSGD